MKAWWVTIQDIGVHNGLDVFDVKRVRLLNILCVLGIAASFAALPWIVIQDGLQGIWGNLASQATIGGVLGLQHRRHYIPASLTILATGLVGLPIQVLAFPETWGIHFWLLPFTLLPHALFFRHIRWIPSLLGWVAVAVFSTCVLIVGMRHADTPSEMAAQILVALTLMLIGQAIRHAANVAEYEAIAQAQKADDIMHRTLPEAAVRKLKAGQTTPFELSHDECTVLLADIVGFTALSTTMASRELIRIVDRVFNEYDQLAAALGLEKIKTIGDAYMIAAGAPDPCANHEETIARLALNIVTATHRVARELDLPLDVRIGIHSGVAWGGVIGQSRIAYDIWGETVNLAARMEQQGVAGRIQLSSETAKRLASQFELKKRGTITVKGIGDLDTYFLVGPREDT